MFLGLWFLFPPFGPLVIVFILIVGRIRLYGFFTRYGSIKVFCDVGVVANEDHHWGRSGLTRGRRSDLIEFLLPLSRECQQSVFSFTVDHFRLWFSTIELLARFEVPG